MSEPALPLSLAVAKDVTEEEYRRAKSQNYLLWGITFFLCTAPALGILLLVGPYLVDTILLGIAAGVVGHLILRQYFKDAAKMSTMRMQRYPELREWKARHLPSP
ncbi:hypothetical protein HW115_12700 [Verrucomicrobiaceae bacterium N1E253]|uniref:Uncharacterized protein n=1 Tax=Oceaniferula marina TaxID=2748318 RepID=A0A851GQM5_9BACT|nr:hypothetical protein [Oceaniferula marina]NWK56474.1 hypothetical protein [Oceaniferula marina]